MVPTWFSIMSAISQLRVEYAVRDLSLVAGFGPTLLTDLTDDPVAGYPIPHCTFAQWKQERQ